MRRALIIGPSLVYCLLSGLPAHAEFWAAGAASTSCGGFNAALKESRPDSYINLQGRRYYTESSDYMQWVYGYIAAQNEARSDHPGTGQQIKVDGDGVAAWIKQYCDKNPASSIYEAASFFVSSFK